MLLQDWPKATAVVVTVAELVETTGRVLEVQHGCCYLVDWQVIALVAIIRDDHDHFIKGHVVLLSAGMDLVVAKTMAIR